MEAHASDAWQDPDNFKDHISIPTPVSFEERGEVADYCVRHLKIPFPALLDDFRNATETAYTAWPDRLYVIDTDGRIAYKSGAGPYGFKPAEAAVALARAVGR